MPAYAILLYPAANRVYADASLGLLRAELAVFAATALDADVTEVAERRIGGVGYVGFTTGTPLGDRDVRLLSNLSALYALFEVTGELLRPVELRGLDRFDSDLLTIQKYPGKTNELFTKLLLNVTLLARDEPSAFLDRPVHVLDPLCGRGTTLNQAMMYGFDVTGADTDGKDFDNYSTFLTTWLKNKRLKHTADSTSLRRDKVRLGRRLDVEYAATKERYKAGEVNRITYFNCDTLETAALLRRESVDVIVTDAPYGVQHGSHRSDGTGPARSPRDLLAAALPVWSRTLRPGGAIGISWNTTVAGREVLTGILTGAGLDVVEDEAYLGFTHRVDQAILRDLIVARKPLAGN
ncbi:SAM-dependent methyltransferase [Amycolatopsis antarctica]|uniref:SAM-dependent methyltransferase n=1 Tax=Amycolatopsis antarctica TaxID=1854586 RepID=A0A263DA72_9PSEU|nr:SAM-dependent methyltransferase [Amycolatopsis antarctica]OZM74386.1 SAM-dependent methyltransferase [Amycolatopsis antarctica]